MKKTRSVRVGNVMIGGSAPVSVQSMCNTATKDTEATISQIRALEKAGCEIVRVGVPDMDSAKALKSIRESISIPLVADIHFDYRLALEAAKHADKLRINPGNIGKEEHVIKVVSAAKDRGLPIRIGINAGSLDKALRKNKRLSLHEAMVESAIRELKVFEGCGFFDTVISLKASDVRTTVEAYRLLAEKVDYPFHIGVSEAGPRYSGIIKSAIGIGSLLLDGIGDTIRVSLTANPEDEVFAGIEMLKALKLREGVDIISCPTCARASIDVIGLASRVEEAARKINRPVRIAVMGCAVNGPGEAKDADVGVTGANGKGIIFRKGSLFKEVEEKDIIDELLRCI